MANRKVAIVTPGSFVIPSGRSSSVERVVEKVAPLAAGLLDVRIYGVAGSGLPTRGEVAGVPCWRLPGGSRYIPSILHHLRIWRPDTVEVHNRPALAYRLKAKLPHTRVLLTLHSTTFISPPRLRSDRALRYLEALDGLIVNSDYLKREVRLRFPSLAREINVNPLGVSLDDFVPRWTPAGEALREARLKDFGWEGAKIVLFVGRLIPSKGGHHLLMAWEEIVKAVPEAILLIIGSAFYGDDRETGYTKRLKAMAATYGGSVRFLPFVPYPKVADWYNLADVLVVPSGEDEAFGLVNVEAMASAVPVVAARVGGIPEVVADGKSGLLYSPAAWREQLSERVAHLLEDRDLRRRMGCFGRELAREHFRWDHTAERWVQLIRES
ncbi:MULTISPECIES: glycosyltransferase family 4 protein [Paenibacillus]|uniref:glycosyltransferase family 4 protein n=1 Tax=Paenibacillus TaxID=44249 RepID=UPI002FE2DAF0